MFQGSIVALITPFKDGEVDYEALGRLIEFHITHGCKEGKGKNKSNSRYRCKRNT